MTTLAIIGSGILGRSLIYTLAKEQKHFDKIVLFFSDKFANPCTLNSTAVVAPRGVTQGHSNLGNEMLEGFRIFSEHVNLERPDGVELIKQNTAATTNLELFRKRYTQAQLINGFLHEQAYTAIEQAYLIDPKTYGDWLLKEALFLSKAKIEVREDFVTEVEDRDGLELKTQNGSQFSFDRVVFAAGSYNRFWLPLAKDTKLKTSKPVQGSYFEFGDVNWNLDSFSLTLDADNLIWNKRLNRLLIGSTSFEANHLLHPQRELASVYERLREKVHLQLPPMSLGKVKVGLREKAQRREPYFIQDGQKYFVGGLYKNGFTLSMKMSQSLSCKLF